MSNPFDKLQAAIDLGAVFELAIIRGPELEAENQLKPFLKGIGADVAWHRVDTLGVDIRASANFVSQEKRVLVVHGFEYVRPDRLADLFTDLNLQRDGLLSIKATIIIWVPDSLFDIFRRYCSDLFAWRSFLEDTVPSARSSGDRNLASYLLTLREHLARTLPDPYIQLKVDASGERYPLGQWLDSVRHGVLFGNPGAGKTVGLAHWVVSSLSDPHSGTGVPLWISAKRFRGEVVRWQKLGQLNEVPISPIVLEDAISEGRLTIIVDALDELYSDELRQELQRILRVAGDWAKIIVATRPNVQLSLPFEKATLLPLDASDVIDYLTSQQSGLANQQPILDMMSQQRFAEWTPLFLTMVQSVANQTGRFESNPYQLVLQYVEGILKEQDAKKGHIRRGRLSSSSQTQEFLERFALIATLVQKQAVSIDWLFENELISQLYEESLYGDALVEELLESAAPILEFDSDRKTLSFSHRLLQETLAATFLRRLPVGDLTEIFERLPPQAEGVIHAFERLFEDRIVFDKRLSEFLGRETRG